MTVGDSGYLKKKKKKEVPGSCLIVHSAFKKTSFLKKELFCFSLSKCKMLWKLHT